MAAGTSEDLTDSKFQEELSWCIENIEINLQTKKLSEKQAKDIVKTISSLKNPKNPLAKKRQLMRVSCGDYRAKMIKEDKSFKMRTNVTSKPKGIQKSIFLKRQNNTSETIDSKKCDQSGFKFNFDVSERLENSEKEPKEEEISEDLVQVERFKLEKSDNSFRFNFSMN